MLSHDMLESYRQVSDHEGDQLIEALYDELSPKQVGQLFQRYMSSLDELDYDDMPTALRTYFMHNMEKTELSELRKFPFIRSVVAEGIMALSIR